MPEQGEPETVVMWCCATCGKWSHAQRNPRHHERFVSEDSPTEPLDATVIEIVEGYHYGEEYSPGGWRVRCGPFDRWEARRVEQ